MDSHLFIIRLDLLERVEDARSQRHLAALGTGHGSIAHWLAKQVGPQGRVVATDINPRFPTGLTLPNIELRRHDIRTDPLQPGLYDLAHCRSVLMQSSISPTRSAWCRTSSATA